MGRIGKKKPQEMLDSGMSRREVAEALGVTYNTIAGMIARGDLTEPEHEKKKYAPYAVRTLSKTPITREELALYRDRVQIGDKIWIDQGEGPEKYRVIEKYRHLCRLENARGKKTTETYVNMIIGSRA